ncbi:MAG: isochorismatase family protein [Desulfobacteraceae bacterium]|nr:isochorismatase family protein [Desulfobacteraceae bacterium]
MDLRVLIIDPQNDFCNKNGALFVPGADDDMVRLSAMINRLKDKISDIHVTLDTHHFVDIAHPTFWVDSDGNHPESLKTVITVDDVENGKWRATNPQLQKRALEYVRSLETNKRYALVIWPYHCLIGSWGYGVYPELYDALLKWEKDFCMVDYVTKGSNIYTEHYSAVQADVPDPQDPSTMLNTRLIQTLEEADIIALSGEALNFCLANTVTDIANNFGEENIKKFVLLTDATSVVPGKDFEPLTENFLKEMTQRGMQVSTTKEFLN